MDPWSPEQLARFLFLRRPAILDLMAGIEPAKAMNILDVGCGSGEVTLELHERFNARATLGIDISKRMLAAAERAAAESDTLRFQLGDVNAVSVSDRFDLVFSNGVFHQVRDHVATLTHWTSLLTETGQLAIQLPSNSDSFPIAMGLELARSPRYVAHSDGVGWSVRALTPREYSETLFALGFSQRRVRLEAESHVLASGSMLLEWLRTTFLADLEAVMPKPVFREYLGEYVTRFEAEIALADPYHYVLQRLYLWAKR